MGRVQSCSWRRASGAGPISFFGHQLNLGAPEEGIAESVFSFWLDSQKPQNMMQEHGIEYFKNALFRLGEPAEPKVGSD